MALAEDAASPVIWQRVFKYAVDAGMRPPGLEGLGLQRQVHGVQREGVGPVQVVRQVAEFTLQATTVPWVRVGDH